MPLILLLPNISYVSSSGDKPHTYPHLGRAMSTNLKGDFQISYKSEKKTNHQSLHDCTYMSPAMNGVSKAQHT